MFDINFYMNTYPIRKELDRGKELNKKEIFELFEKYRDKNPIIYNIETTNACNMRCKMCPRTTMMTRNIETIAKDVFINIVDQIKPHHEEDWLKWEKFVFDTYGIPKDEMSENNFFLYIIPKVIQLHGYGDPLLDKHLHEYVKLLTEKGFDSYFSCNPANINLQQTALMLENGLSFIKYSIESVEDEEFKSIRGNASNFTESFETIKEVIRIKEENNYQTKIIITMLDLNRTGQVEEFKKLSKVFEDLDVYIYLKSEDQQWYRQDYHGTNSVHWSEFCKHPWMSMTIKSNGEAVMCMEDYNNEIILGDANKELLIDIWNGKKYDQFRHDHFNVAKGFKCNEECDMKLIGQYFN
jgi:radical SAM protein with 4Fe4S-binding SPASM domain